MDNGESGFLLVVVSPAEPGLNIGPDSATVLHLPMEEKVVPEKIPRPLLATKGTALMVKQFLNYAIQTYYLNGKNCDLWQFFLTSY
jgi:hypothetical protein